MESVTCNQFQMTSTDGLQIACARWSNRKPPRGLLQIAHGMGEHIWRYQTLIEELAHAGLVVYGNDHRGHGRTARSPKELGDFGSGGFSLMVKDMVRLSRDPAVADAFMRDPLCFGTLQPASMQSFLAAATQLANARRLRGIRRALP